MKLKKTFGKYLSNEKDKELIVKNNFRLGKMLNECCQDYDETDIEGKLMIIKTIITLLMKLMYGDNEIQIEFQHIIKD